MVNYIIIVTSLVPLNRIEHSIFCCFVILSIDRMWLFHIRIIWMGIHDEWSCLTCGYLFTFSWCFLHWVYLFRYNALLLDIDWCVMSVHAVALTNICHIVFQTYDRYKFCMVTWDGFSRNITSVSQVLVTESLWFNLADWFLGFSRATTFSRV